MAHWSEEAESLNVVNVSLPEIDQLCVLDYRPHVCLLILPYETQHIDSERKKLWFDRLYKFASSLPDDSVLCILTTPRDATNTWIHFVDVLHFQSWIAVKLKEPIVDNLSRRLPEHHATLLVMTKYQTSLRHNKTRIAYTYCPACDKTTKDYGGKKHTYHEYGTLMSDVWRDITFSANGGVGQIVERLSDMFGLTPLYYPACYRPY